MALNFLYLIESSKTLENYIENSGILKNAYWSRIKFSEH